MTSFIIGLIVGVAAGWYTTRPALVDRVVQQVVGFVESLKK